jgi:hypothetical protein
MSEDAWPKVGASAGIVAAVLLILGFVFGPTDAPPGFGDSAREVQEFILDNHGKLQAQVAFGFATIVAFTWFLGAVFYRLRPAERAARLSVAALAGGVLLAVGAVLGSAGQAAAAYHADTLDPNTVRALWDLSVFGFLFFTAGLAVLAGATGVLGVRAGALPSWLGAYSLLVGCYAFVVGFVASFSETGAFSPSDGALGLIAFVLFIVWLLGMGIVLYRKPLPLPHPGEPVEAGPAPLA